MVERKNLVAVGPEAQAGDADQAAPAEYETSTEEYLIEDEWVEDEPVRRLGRFPFWRGATPLIEAVEPLYVGASRRALDLLTADPADA